MVKLKDIAYAGLALFTAFYFKNCDCGGNPEENIDQDSQIAQQDGAHENKDSNNINKDANELTDAEMDAALKDVNFEDVCCDAGHDANINPDEEQPDANENDGGYDANNFDSSYDSSLEDRVNSDTSYDANLGDTTTSDTAYDASTDANQTDTGYDAGIPKCDTLYSLDYTIPSDWNVEATPEFFFNEFQTVTNYDRVKNLEAEITGNFLFKGEYDPVNYPDSKYKITDAVLFRITEGICYIQLPADQANTAYQEASK